MADVADVQSEEIVDTPEQAEFRTRARAWLAANVKKQHVRGADDDSEGESMFDEMRAEDEKAWLEGARSFQAALFDAGFAGLTWSKEHGGQGLDNRFQEIWGEEISGYDFSPTGAFIIGLGMCGPTLLTLGTEEQKDRYIRPMLRGDELWCQLFSEPGAGSDVASLQARAVRDGEEWIVNGQKVWTSGAHYADYGILIARTDPDQPKHRGISMFIVDMQTPGITCKPLRQITGGANFNEVFFDDTRIPAENLVGEINEGWRGAITMLMNERVAIGAGSGGSMRRGGGAQALIKLARERRLDTDPEVRQGIADIYIRQTILGYIGMRIRDALRSGRVPGPEGSIAKLSGSQLGWRSAELGMAIAGPGSAAWDAGDAKGSRLAMAVVGAPAGSIAGGTDQIQRNIIGERVLGLPKDPAIDREVPFRELKVGTQR